MDAVEFLKTLRRMCNSECRECELGKRLGALDTCALWQKAHPEEAVEIAEKWAKEHPAKTRQSEFLKHYPGARITIDGFLRVCPMNVFSDTGISCNARSCSECRKAFWLAEVEDA